MGLPLTPDPKNLNQIDRLPRTEPKSIRLVKSNIFKWKPGTELSHDRRELEVVWEWMESQAKAEGKSMHDMPVQNAGVRLSLTYMRWILDEDKEFSVKDLRHEAMSSVDEYLKWDISEMGAFTYRLATLQTKKQLRQQFRLVAKMMMKNIKDGRSSDIPTYLKSTGNYMEESDAKEAYKVIPVLEIPQEPTEAPNLRVVSPSK